MNIKGDKFRLTRMKRETGANPVRSRHCNRERAAIMSLRKPWEGAARCELKSGELLVF